MSSQVVAQVVVANTKLPKRGPRGGIYDPFPLKFYRMLDQIRDEGLESVVSWLPHGTSAETLYAVRCNNACARPTII